MLLFSMASMMLGLLSTISSSFAADDIPASTLQVRPNLYFGIRERKDPGVLIGMGWFQGSSSNQLRYECREQDHLKKWGFLKADENFGIQSFVDDRLLLTTEHVLIGNELNLRVNGSSDSSIVVNLLFTVHSPVNKLVVEGHTAETAQTKGLRGNSAAAILGNTRFRVDWSSAQQHEDDVCTEHTERIRPGKPAPELLRTHYSAWADKDPTLAWKGVSESIKHILKQSEHAAKTVARKLFRLYDPSEEATIGQRIAPLLDNKVASKATTAVFQRALKTPFSVLVTLSAVQQQSPDEDEDKRTVTMTSLLRERERAFDAKFIGLLHVTKSDTFITQEMLEMAQASLSNTIGSIAWFYGSNLLEDGTWSNPPGELLTGVPSRSFFPRGFFWDEGFHQLLVAHFNPRLAKQVISSWLTRFDSQGWVAREQVLGLEAIERVPREFLKQFRTYANPPTLLLAVESLQEDSDDVAFLTKVYDTFMRHRAWLAKSQTSAAGEGLMAWKGRSADGIHTLTSGIDDYPRGGTSSSSAGPVDFSREAHVDLLSWAAWEDLALARLAKNLNRKEDEQRLEDSAQNRIQFILKHHWNSKLGFFNDLGFPTATFQHPQLVPHVGYVGLMPFVLKLVPVHEIEKLWDILKALQSPQLLRAPGIGIRSLAKSDALFGQGENYWRGAVWININYLCVQALKHYSENTKTIDAAFSSLASSLAREIQRDIIRNIFKQYKQEGFLFESYDSLTGKGRGTRPFTGWTALVVLMMRDELK